MKELLVDNISLVQQLEAVQSYAPLPTVGPSRPRLHEVTSLSSWCYCFLGYMAIVTSDPNTRDQLAYARLVIREALRHGGTGWMEYNRAFRQQAAVDSTLRWNTLLPGLQAATIHGQRNRQEASFCTLCHEGDHSRAQSYLHPAPARSMPSSYSAGVKRRSENIMLLMEQGYLCLPGLLRMCAQHVTFSTKRETARGPQTTPPSSSNSGAHHAHHSLNKPHPTPPTHDVWENTVNCVAIHLGFADSRDQMYEYSVVF